ncbi:nucleotidyltransferase [bacterium]|nr:nucleotidyltransferase [bacterium]
MARDVSIHELKKAVATLAEAVAFATASRNDDVPFRLARDACIQRFEYSIELAWKVSMRALGSQIKHAKVAVREMARADLIDSAETWLDFIEARNNSSHSYDENVAQKVFAQVEAFLPEVQKLLARLERLP